MLRENRTARLRALMKVARNGFGARGISDSVEFKFSSFKIHTLSQDPRKGGVPGAYCAGVSAYVGGGASAVASGAATGLIFTVARIFSRQSKTLSRSTCFMTPSSEATVVTLRANS